MAYNTQNREWLKEWAKENLSPLRHGVYLKGFSPCLSVAVVNKAVAGLQD